MTGAGPEATRRAEALVRRIERLEREIEALLETDRARPSLIPPALADLSSLPPAYAAALRPAAKSAPRRPRRPPAEERGAEIGRRIREARRAAGMTQLDLANATGIRRPNVARLERGGNTPTLETLRRVAAALEIPLTDLVTAG